MRRNGHIREHLRPRGRFVSAHPTEYIQQQANSEGYRSGDNLIFRETGNECSQRQQGSSQKEYSQISDEQRFPVGIAVFKQERKVQSSKQKQASVEHQRSQPLANDHFNVAYG